MLSLFSNRFAFPSKILYLALITPLAQIVALFAEQRVPRAMWVRLPIIPAFYALDILAAVRAMVASLMRRERVWTRTARAGASSQTW